MMRNIILLVVVLLSFGVGLAGAADAKKEEKSSLTHGQVQLTLKKGKTTKLEVLETFGSPNITTYDASDREVWTYQKHATISKSSKKDSWGTIILFGGSSATAGFEQSSRTMTLIIKFDEKDRVYDFRSRFTSF